MLDYSVAKASVAPLTRRAYENDLAIDFEKDEFAQKLCLLALSRMTGVDFEKVRVSGDLATAGAKHPVHIVVWDAQGVRSTYDFDGLGFAGTLHVEAREGCDIESALHHPFKGIADYWLRANGLPDGFPCDVDVEGNTKGDLVIRVRPCI